MKTFQLTGDKNRLYFQNPSRRPGEDELTEVLQILLKKGFEIGEKFQSGLDDIYNIKSNNLTFTLIFTGEEAVLYTDCTDDIPKIEEIFSC